MISETQHRRFFNRPQTHIVILIASVCTFAYFILGWNVINDVYKYPVVGALYELLWLPSYLALIAVPALAIINLAKNRRSLWLSISSLLFIAASFLIIFR